MLELSIELWSNEILASTFLGCHPLASDDHLWRHEEEVDELDEGTVYHLPSRPRAERRGEEEAGGDTTHILPNYTPSRNDFLSCT
jgi:hypothetical protein